MPIRCIAFDCFGTVFDMSGVSREEIKAYVDHVRKNDFTPYSFPESWFDLKAHADAEEGIRALRKMGFFCCSLSNGSVGLLSHVSRKNEILWDYVIDLKKHRVYKPHVDAYRTIQGICRFTPQETLMVTANPTFGDLEGAKAIGMHSQVIRNGYPNTIIELADMLNTEPTK